MNDFGYEKSSLQMMALYVLDCDLTKVILFKAHNRT